VAELKRDTMEATTPAQPRRPHILIVDDVPENIEVLAAALGDEYEVIFAVSGEEAIEIASNQRIDLVLLDIMMPDVDGYEVCRLFKVEPQLADIPVIFVTAKTETEDEAKGFAAGGVDYITKPIKRLAVRARVKAHLDLRRSRDRLKGQALVQGTVGVPNRATFDSVLDREIKRAQLDARPLSLLLLGIDAFDEIARAQGRFGVQRVLERVAQAVAAQASGPLDLCAHFGGPQFALLLPQATDVAASARATALVEAVARIGLTHGEGAERRPLTACVGGVSADFMLIDPMLRVRAHEMTLAAMRALDQAAAKGQAQVSVQRWEMTPASI
jgi:diguanylate cyclase (GGDEF)-like protein